MSQATISGVINGVDVDRLGATIQAVQQNTSLATFQIPRKESMDRRAGTIARPSRASTARAQEDTVRKKPFVLDSDEPPVLFGKDQGANPV